jgi:hypothetical protein
MDWIFFWTLLAQIALASVLLALPVGFFFYFVVSLVSGARKKAGSKTFIYNGYGDL